MANKGWIVKDLNDPKLLKIELRSQKPANAICEAPKVNNKYELDIRVVEVKEGKAEVNVDKWNARKRGDLDKKLDVEEARDKRLRNLPLVEVFMEAYLEERDGKPLKMDGLRADYIKLLQKYPDKK